MCYLATLHSAGSWLAANKTAESRLRHTRGKNVNLNLFTHFQSPVNYQKTFFFVNKLQIPIFQTKLSDLYALKRSFTLCRMSPMTFQMIHQYQSLIVNFEFESSALSYATNDLYSNFLEIFRDPAGSRKSILSFCIFGW